MQYSLRGAIRDRLRLVGSAFLTGALLGTLVVVALFVYAGEVGFADRKAFAVGALFFGLALVGWAGSIMAGPGFENLQHHLDLKTNWSAADSRQAMAQIGGAGFGWMVGVSVSTQLLLLVS